MIILLLAVLSVWLLSSLFISNRKGELPSWMHKWMYRDRYNLDPLKIDHVSSGMRWVPFVFLLLGSPFFIVLFLCNIYVWIAEPYDKFFQPLSGWGFFRKSGVISTITVIICLWIPFYFMPKISKTFKKYTIDLVKREKEEAIRKQYGNTGWASEEDKNKPL